MLETLKVSGLGNLNSYSRIPIVGTSGSIIVEITIMGGRYFVFFVFLCCHLIFILFVVGNIVIEVVYIIRV